MFASIQSVSLITALLYTVTLSAVIEETYSNGNDDKKVFSFLFSFRHIQNYTKTSNKLIDKPTECSKLHRFSVILSRFAAKYCASISISFSAFASICGNALKNCFCICSAVISMGSTLFLLDVGLDPPRNVRRAQKYRYFHWTLRLFFFHIKFIPSLEAALFIFNSKLSATKCVILLSSTRTDPCGKDAKKRKYQCPFGWNNKNVIAYIARNDGDSTDSAFVLQSQSLDLLQGQALHQLVSSKFHCTTRSSMHWPSNYFPALRCRCFHSPCLSPTDWDLLIAVLDSTIDIYWPLLSLWWCVWKLIIFRGWYADDNRRNCILNKMHEMSFQLIFIARRYHSTRN